MQLLIGVETPTTPTQAKKEVKEVSRFGKRTGGSARRPNECFVLEPSEMIVLEQRREGLFRVQDTVLVCTRIGGDFEGLGLLWPLRALVFQEKENSGLEVAPTPYVAA
uniref:Uncharacterized protein n=1 Tax=Timema cristinae TaxID=61476 RepID=A0A7R9CFY1_TIMCR|nr:unnamed protein product [Timema cristinae]